MFETLIKSLCTVLLSVVYIPTVLSVVGYIKILAWYRGGDIDTRPDGSWPRDD